MKPPPYGERTPAWMFDDIPEHTLRRWAKSMTMFRFVCSHPYHDVMDSLKALFLLPSEEELHAFYGLFGIRLRTLSPGEPTQDNPGPNTKDRYSLPRRYRGYSHLAVPQVWQRPFGHIACFIHYPSAASISISTNSSLSGVGDRDVEVAQLLELQLQPFRARLREPPVRSRSCVCPHFYPEFWQDLPIDPKRAIPPLV